MRSCTEFIPQTDYIIAADSVLDDRDDLFVSSSPLCCASSLLHDVHTYHRRSILVCACGTLRMGGNVDRVSVSLCMDACMCACEC